MISNFPFANSEYIIDINCKIKCEMNNNDKFFEV